MGQASVFIGSSSEALEVARAISEGLECCADPVIWDEDVFEFGRGYLEELMAELEKHDFAVLVLTPDDVVESRGDNQRSPRDNVLFELGLFMGKLGRERTFIVCDSSTKMKLPSDLAGVSFITYEGKRMADAPSSAVRGACMRINRVIKKPQHRELSGTWRSKYLLCYSGEKGEPVVEDVVVKPARGMLCIESKSNEKNDNYVAYGRMVTAKHLVGEWQSTRHAATAGGPFFLTVHPQGNLMYGYFASPGDDHKVTHGGWVMARLGLGDKMAQREGLGRDDGDGAAPASEAKAGGNGNGARGAGESEEKKFRKKLEGELDKLLKQGVKLLKQSAPALTELQAPSRNGPSSPSAKKSGGRARRGGAKRGAA